MSIYNPTPNDINLEPKWELRIAATVLWFVRDNLGQPRRFSMENAFWMSAGKYGKIERKFSLDQTGFGGAPLFFCRRAGSI